MGRPLIESTVPIHLAQRVSLPAGSLAVMNAINPTTILDFQRRFDSEEACEAVLFQWRRPDGFRCPRCGGAQAIRLATRRLMFRDALTLDALQATAESSG